MFCGVVCVIQFIDYKLGRREIDQVGTYYIHSPLEIWQMFVDNCLAKYFYRYGFAGRRAGVDLEAQQNRAADAA